MAVLIPNWFFVLLPLAMLLASVATSEIVPPRSVNVTVSIKSQMGNATTLSVHCRAYWGGPPIPIIDLGEHKLGNEELYSFSFQEDSPPELDRRVYMCQYQATGYPVHQFYVHYPHLCKCVQGKCPLRIVKPQGFFCRDVLVDKWAEPV